MSNAVFSNLEAARIVLRHFRDADLPSFLTYRNDPEVARFQSWESLNKHEAHTFIQQQKTLHPGVAGQWFQFAIELKETQQLVGDCGLKVHQQDTQQAEIGFTLSRDIKAEVLRRRRSLACWITRSSTWLCIVLSPLRTARMPLCSNA